MVKLFYKYKHIIFQGLTSLRKVIIQIVIILDGLHGKFCNMCSSSTHVNFGFQFCSEDFVQNSSFKSKIFSNESKVFGNCHWIIKASSDHVKIWSQKNSHLIDWKGSLMKWKWCQMFFIFSSFYKMCNLLWKLIYADATLTKMINYEKQLIYIF